MKNFSKGMLFLVLLILSISFFGAKCTDKPPTDVVMIVSPENGSIVKGEVKVEVIVSTDTLPKEVTLFIGRLGVTLTSAPYEYLWNTEEFEDTSYAIYAKATYENGEQFTSKYLGVVVANGEHTVVLDSSGRLSIPKNYQPGMEVDVKYNWELPANVGKIVGLLTWEEPNWNLEYSIGTGECPHKGTILSSGETELCAIALSYMGKENLDEGTLWFSHIKPLNPQEHIGERLPFHWIIVMYPKN